MGGLNYLLDTNIFLELLLDQDKAKTVEQLLSSIPTPNLFITDFSLYSIGLILIRRKMFDVFTQFVDDVLVHGGIHVLRLSISDFDEVKNVAEKFELDFDDSYQYVAAKKHELTFVSFDRDFDNTDRGRRTPDQIVSESSK